MTDGDGHQQTAERTGAGIARRVSYALLVLAGMSILVRLFVPGLPAGLTSALNLATLPAVIVAIGIHLWVDLRAARAGGGAGAGG